MGQAVFGSLRTAPVGGPAMEISRGLEIRRSPVGDFPVAEGST
jgi:hypothetical protein